MSKEKNLILYVGSDLSPPHTTMEAKIVDVLTKQLKEKYDFKIISINVSTGKQKQLNTCSVGGLKKGPILIRKLAYGVELLLVYLTVLVKRQVDTVHFIWVGFDPLTQIMIKLAKRKGIKVIVTILNRQVPMSRYNSADQLVFHSSYSKDKLIKSHPDIEFAKVIPPPVILKSFTKKEKPCFVFASAPRTKAQIEERGVYLLMYAMLVLQNANSEINLRFIGRWAEGAQLLQNIVEQRGLKNVVMSHNHVDNIDRIIGEASGLIIPYVGGNTGDVPLSALESLAFGTPVISTHEFHMTSADEMPAIRLCTQDAVELANAMIEVSKLGDVSQQCKNLVKECNTEHFIESYDELYREYGNE